MSDQNHNDRAGKSDFDSIYNRDDPRAYFRTLAPLKYSAPAHGTPIFRNCADQIADLREKPQIDVLDLCCGYGINGALLKHDIDLKDIYSRYASKDSAALSPADLVEADKQFFAEVEAERGPIDEIIGIDVAENAVRYAKAVGFIDEGAAINLEEKDLPAPIAAQAEHCDLVTVTGGMGYISSETFEKVLDCTETDELPWVVSFPLCSVPIDEFVETFEQYDLTVETWDDFTFPQRLYSSETERTRMEAAITAAGHVAPEEFDENFVPSRLLMARPDDEARKVPMADLIPWDSAPRPKGSNARAQPHSPERSEHLPPTKVFC